MQLVELRQYTPRPGRWDTLVELFDREFVETRVAVGMRIVGQAAISTISIASCGRVPSRTRGRALAAFYGARYGRRTVRRRTSR